MPLPRADSHQGSISDLSEEKVVVLVGCTQHGKSSLIRSILDYGGHREEAQAVQCGSFGNRSTTKETKSFITKTKFKDHFLKYKNGKRKEIDKIPDDLWDDGCYTPVSKPTSNEIRLRIIDTPGLDDTENATEEEKRAATQGKNSGSGMRVVDEAHKFKVFKAIAAVGKVHAVCFVLDINNNMGDGLQKIYKEYMQIFRSLGLPASFHFAHTKVTVDELFDKAKGRPSKVEQTFSLQYFDPQHHFIGFMNPPPLENDPITEHFAAVGICNMLKVFHETTSQNVSMLRYPKTAHTVWDKALNESLNIQKQEWQIEITNFRANQRRLENENTDLEKRHQEESNSWSKLYNECNALDRTDLVQTGYQRRYERAHTSQTNRLYFSVSSISPIRKEEEWSCCDSSFYGYSFKLGDMSGSATLTGTGWGKSVEGKITLYGYIKEAKADELAQKRREEGQAWTDKQNTYSRIDRLKVDIKTKATEITALEKRVMELQTERSIFTAEYIPKWSIECRGEYFGYPSMIGYGYGQDLKRYVSRDLLSKVRTTIPYGRMKTTYENKHKDFQTQLVTCKKMVILLESLVSDNKKNLAMLQKHQAQLKKHLDECEAEADSFDMWTPKTTLEKALSDEEKEDGNLVLERLFGPLRERAERSSELVVRTLEDRGIALERRKGLYSKAEQIVQTRIKESQELLEKWTGQVLDREASIAAAKAVMDTTEITSLPLSTFTVLRQGLEDSSSGSQVPWDRLFFQYKDAYLSNPGNWDIFWAYLAASNGLGSSPMDVDDLLLMEL